MSTSSERVARANELYRKKQYIEQYQRYENINPAMYGAKVCLWTMIPCTAVILIWFGAAGWLTAGVFIAVMAGFIAYGWFLFAVGSRSIKKHQVTISQYREELAPKTQGASGEDDNRVHRSKRQTQRDWYGYDGRNDDLNWRDREQAEAWGMDADTYRSNWLESD